MKGLKKYMAGILVAGMVLGSAAVPAPVYATEAEDAQEDNGDDVEITLDDKPYLALGADLTADQQHTVLSYMGIEAADFDKYDVVFSFVYFAAQQKDRLFICQKKLIIIYD